LELFIYANGVDLTDKIKRQTHEKLDLALDRLADDVERICVYLVDTNGPLLGGIDKACRVVVQVRSQEAIVIEDIDETVDVVIERITDRLGVAAGQRADSRKRKWHPIRRWLDSEDHPLLDVKDSTKV
jgi:hypothetical protein